MGRAVKNSLEIVIKQVRLEGGFKRRGRIRVAECLRQIVPDRWASIRKRSTVCFLFFFLLYLFYLTVCFPRFFVVRDDGIDGTSFSCPSPSFDLCGWLRVKHLQDQIFFFTEFICLTTTPVTEMELIAAGVRRTWCCGRSILQIPLTKWCMWCNVQCSRPLLCLNDNDCVVVVVMVVVITRNT